MEVVSKLWPKTGLFKITKHTQLLLQTFNDPKSNICVKFKTNSKKVQQASKTRRFLPQAWVYVNNGVMANPKDE